MKSRMRERRTYGSVRGESYCSNLKKEKQRRGKKKMNNNGSRLLDKYEQIKQKYEDYIVIQNQGIFYTVYGLDAYIISYIFDYQIN